MAEYVATVTSKGQLTLPVALRRQLRIGAGDQVAFVVNGDNEARLRRVDHDLESLRGVFKTPPGLVTGDFDDLIEEAMNDHADWVTTRMREGAE